MSTICAGCGEKIDDYGGDEVESLDYCDECADDPEVVPLVCSKCGIDFLGPPFLLIDQNAKCDGCYQSVNHSKG